MTPLLRQLIFWSAIGLGGLALWALAQLALLPSAAQSARLGEATSAVQGLAARQAHLAAELGALPIAAPGFDPRLDVEADVPTGLQQFQERVRDALAAVGGQPVLSQTATEAGSASLTTLKILLRARMDEPGLMAFLKQLESGEPAILVSDLEVQPIPGGAPGILDVAATMEVIHTDAH